MIKSNKVNNIVRLPRISMPVMAQVIPVSARPKLLLYRSKMKQNYNPKESAQDSTNIESVQGKKISNEQKNNENRQYLDESMFATRASCLSLKRDMRARIRKYSQERALFLTERNKKSCCEVTEKLIQAALNMQKNNNEKIDFSFPQKMLKNERPIQQKIRQPKKIGSESVTRWGNKKDDQFTLEAQDIILEEFVGLCLANTK